VSKGDATDPCTSNSETHSFKVVNNGSTAVDTASLAIQGWFDSGVATSGPSGGDAWRSHVYDSTGVQIDPSGIGAAVGRQSGSFGAMSTLMRFSFATSFSIPPGGYLVAGDGSPFAFLVSSNPTFDTGCNTNYSNVGGATPYMPGLFYEDSHWQLLEGSVPVCEYIDAGTLDPNSGQAPLGSDTATPSPAPSATPTANIIATALAGTLTATYIQGFFSPTRTTTPTVSPSITPTPAPSVTVDGQRDFVAFEGSDLFAYATFAQSGSSVTGTLVGGCPYGSSVTGFRANGDSLTTGSAFLLLNAGLPLDMSVAESAARTLTFHLLNNGPAGISYELVVASGATYFVVVVRASASGVWADVTVATPDNENPGSLPQLQPLGGAVWSSVISQVTQLQVTPLVTGSFDFTVDDFTWGAPPSGASPSQVGNAFSAPLTDVQQAYSYGLDDQATWILIVLSRHCGCHPSTVMGWRATMSWGEMAVQAGTTWAAVLAEVDADMAAAGLSAAQPQPDQLLRTLRNGPGDTTPLPTPTAYVPTGPLVLPPAGGC